MQITEAEQVAPRPTEKDYRPGELDNRVLLKGKEGSPGNFKFNIGRAVKEWSTPRHKHDFDQIRYLLDGEFVYGKDQALTPGHVAFFPAGIHYGPQIRRDGTHMVLVQFGGAEGNGFISTEQREAATDILRREGEFKDGVFIYRDKDGKLHQKDASEAVRERAIGHDVAYPQPRYDGIITMNPANFSWIDLPGAAGVQTKWLLSFTERNAQVGFIRIGAGATFQAGMHDAPELLLLTKGAVSAGTGNRTYGQFTAFGLEPNEGPVPLAAAQETELFCVRLPKF